LSFQTFKGITSNSRFFSGFSAIPANSRASKPGKEAFAQEFFPRARAILSGSLIAAGIRRTTLVKLAEPEFWTAKRAVIAQPKNGRIRFPDAAAIVSAAARSATFESPYFR
jgi:hypothetical protein